RHSDRAVLADVPWSGSRPTGGTGRSPSRMPRVAPVPMASAGRGYGTAVFPVGKLAPEVARPGRNCGARRDTRRRTGRRYGISPSPVTSRPSAGSAPEADRIDLAGRMADAVPPEPGCRSWPGSPARSRSRSHVRRVRGPRAGSADGGGVGLELDVGGEPVGQFHEQAEQEAVPE